MTDTTSEAECILRDLFVAPIQDEDGNTQTPAFLAEMFVRNERSVYGTICDAYQVRCSYFSGPRDGEDDGESGWVYGSARARLQWKHFTYYECPISETELAIRASEGYLRRRVA